MKNILHWTLGGFFRTIGRYLAIALIMIALGAILSSNGFKLPDWLGLSYIHAETLTTWTTQQGRIQTTHDGTDTWSSWSNISGDNSLVYSGTSLTYPVKAIAYHLKTNAGLSRNNEYSFRINYKPTPDSLHLQNYSFENSTTGQTENVVCTQTQASSGYYWLSCSFSPQTDYSANDYLYVKLNFYQTYQTDLRIGVRGFETLLGTNAVITEQTENIINNINNANEQLIQSLQDQNYVCKDYGYSNIVIDNQRIIEDGTIQTNQNQYGISGYIKIDKNTKIKVKNNLSIQNRAAACFYNVNKELISCVVESDLTVNQIITIPNNSSYFRFTIYKNTQEPLLEICVNGNQALNDNMLDLIHDINNNDTEQALNGYKSFFNLFNNNGHGLTSIVSVPLNAINSLSNSTCSPLVLPLPYMQNKNITLPCMRPIYEEHFGNFITLYDTITFGIISYWIILKLFKLIKNFKNPEDEGIEVVDL